MAIISGYKGRINLFTTADVGVADDDYLNTYITSWKVSFVRNVTQNIEILTTATSAARGTVKATWAEPGYTTWNADIEGYLDGSKANRPIDNVILDRAYLLRLFDGDNNIYQGICHFSSLDIENPHDGFVTYSATVAGDGRLRISDSSS